MSELTDRTRINEIHENLDNSDKILVRYIEDLIVILMRKDILKLQEIPETIRDTVTYRKKLRIEMQELEEGINSINEK
jgi:hypothetical protein